MGIIRNLSKMATRFLTMLIRPHAELLMQAKLGEIYRSQQANRAQRQPGAGALRARSSQAKRRRRARATTRRGYKKWGR